MNIDAGCPEKIEEEAIYSFGYPIEQEKKKEYADCLDMRLEETT